MAPQALCQPKRTVPFVVVSLTGDKCLIRCQVVLSEEPRQAQLWLPSLALLLTIVPQSRPKSIKFKVSCKMTFRHHCHGENIEGSVVFTADHTCVQNV